MAADRRRQKGTGTITRKTRADGRTYYVGRVEAGYTRSGARRRVEVSGPTEADVKRKIAARQRELAAGADLLTKTRVKTWAEQWLATEANKLRPNTLSGYRSAIRQHIVPTIGHRYLADLTPTDIRAVRTAVLTTPRSGRRIGPRSSSMALSVHRILTAMLRDAIVEGHAVPERVLHVDAPAAAESDRAALDSDQALAVLAIAAGEPDGSRWVAALLQGMRQGECLGLTWECVDLATGLIDVSWQLQRLPWKHGCGGACASRHGGWCPDRTLAIPDGYAARQLDNALCLVRPKTQAGRRIIPMVPWMRAALTSWRDSAPTSPHGLVWPRPDGRPRIAADDLAAWKDLLDRAQVLHPTGRQYLLHEARHTTATLLLEAGVDAEVIRAIVGHSSVLVTRGYQHVDQSMARAALEKVAARLQLG